jgi:hypothetical protein
MFETSPGAYTEEIGEKPAGASGRAHPREQHDDG